MLGVKCRMQSCQPSRFVHDSHGKCLVSCAHKNDLSREITIFHDNVQFHILYLLLCGVVLELHHCLYLGMS